MTGKPQRRRGDPASAAEQLYLARPRGAQAEAARLAARRDRAAHAGRRHRAHRAVPDRRHPRRQRGVHGDVRLLLFTVSAVYHRGTWSPRTWSILQRLDHASIFLLIAGSYTPFALVLLEGSARTTLLAIAWGGAPAGRRLPAAVAGRAALVLHADLHRARLGGGVLRRRLRRPRQYGGVRADRHRRAPLHARRAGLRAAATRTRSRRGSASTRCSTPSRSWRSSPTTSASRWRRPPCADGTDAVPPEKNRVVRPVALDRSGPSGYLRRTQMSFDRRCEPVSPRRSHRMPEGP